MKIKLLSALLLLSVCCTAQNFGSKTYALVVGISEYPDSSRRLDYAHKDAIAFYDYLISKAGGAVPPEHITLLTDSLAKVGRIYDALYDFRLKVKQNDKVYFYFAGHGDVETDTIYDLGYLLAYDTPSKCYSHNAIAMRILNEEAARLSVNVGAKVVYILDACRAGELAGDANQGRILARQKMREREAKEVRIMSCGPDELSYEDKSLKRGIFSYHFIRGLQGMAKEEEIDSHVTLRGIEDYLDDAVGDIDLNGKSQNPEVDGEDDFKLAKVNEEILAAIRMQDGPRDETLVMASPIIPRSANVQGRGNVSANPARVVVKPSLTDLVSGIQHSGILDHPDFLKKLDGKDVSFYRFIFKALKDSTARLNQKEQLAFEYYSKQAGDLEKDKTQRGKLNRELALSLNEIGQEAINAYLDTDFKELNNRLYTGLGASYTKYPLIMKRAMELLEEDHPLYLDLKIKYYYYNGVVKRLQLGKITTSESFQTLIQEAMAEQQKAFELDQNIPYVHNEMGILYGFLNDKEKSEKHYKKAIQLAPSWALPYSNLSSFYNGKKEFEKAIHYADTAIVFRPDYFNAYINLGNSYLQQQNLLSAEVNLKKAMDLNKDFYSSYEKMGHLYLATNNYKEADQAFIEADERKGVYKTMFLGMNETIIPAGVQWDQNSINLAGTTMFAEMEGPPCSSVVAPELDKRLKANPNDVEAWFEYAQLNEAEGCIRVAVIQYEKVIKLKPDHIKALLALGKIYEKDRDYKNAVRIYYMVVEIDRENLEILTKLADMLNFKLKEYQASVPIYYRVIRLTPKDAKINRTLAEMFFHQNRYEEADIFYKKLVSLLPQDTLLLFDLADFYENWEHYESAESYYRDFIDRTDDEDLKNKAQYKFFHLLVKLERYLEAEILLLTFGHKNEIKIFYQDRLAASPDNVHWLFRLAEQEYEARGTAENTIQKYEKLLNLEPDHESLTEIYIKLGDLYARLNETNESSEWYAKAIIRDTSNVNVYFKIIDNHLGINQKIEALSYLEVIYNNQKINFEKRLTLSNLLTLAGRHSEAEEVLDKAAEIYPLDLVEIYESYSLLYMLTKDHQKAILNNQKLVELKPDDQADVAYNLTRIYSEMEDLDSALNWLEKALSKGFKYDRVLNYDPSLNNLRVQEASAFEALLERHELEKL